MEIKFEGDANSPMTVGHKDWTVNRWLSTSPPRKFRYACLVADRAPLLRRLNPEELRGGDRPH